MVDLLQRAQQVDRAIAGTINKVTHDINKNSFSLYTDGGMIDFKSLWDTPIEKYCMIEMASRQMLRLMSINFLEKNVTLYKSGDTTSGVSNHVSDEVHLYDYSYTEGNNYLHDYQMEADKTTTKTVVDNNNIQNYTKNGHNTLYGIMMNAYYDDNDSGTDKFGPSRKIEYYDANNNRNSILRKTKQMFRDRKMGTLISRFHTDNEHLQHSDVSETARSVYGLSHGRNLLTYDAERNGISYDTNGYNNPYCRVWTHHHQYSEYRSRMMRPFVIGDAENSESVRNTDLHKWDEFPNFKYNVESSEYDPNMISGVDFKPTIGPGGLAVLPELKKGGYNTTSKEIEWGWKDKGAKGWEHSVLNKETGLVNITPKFLGGADKNVHTKDCMFSIENLAWQGYDPYSFERALSWEQRGPFGGRIMWFPPYGLQFNEDSTVNWNEHSFIGRGENVFTYANTARSGTLSFMMVVDHPSILDYATWHDPKDLKDTDVFRFFAGCDFGGDGGANGGNGGSGKGILQSFAKPTPLTDEYLAPDKGPDPIAVTENVVQEPATPNKTEDPPTDEEIEISFYTFFPNNYSGYYDREGGKYSGGSFIEPIGYLLCGDGSGWVCNDTDVTKSQVIPTNFEVVEGRTFLNGKGYEMDGSGSSDTQDNEKNYIAGTDSYNTKIYVPSRGKNGIFNKKWYYRIDGEYVGGIKYDEIENTFGQTLKRKTGYKDRLTFQLNSSVRNVIQFFEISGEKANNTYSLGEVAYALFNDNEPIRNKIKANMGSSFTQDRIDQLLKYFGKIKENDFNYTIESISCVGYSNSHGDNKLKNTNDTRNNFLARERRLTVLSWFTKYFKKDLKVDDTEQIYHAGQNVENTEDESGRTAKKWRSARMSIKIKKSSVKNIQQLNMPQSNVGNNGMDIILSSGSCEDGEGTVPYEYIYNGSNENIPEVISATELNDYVKRYPNERNNFNIKSCAKKVEASDGNTLNRQEEGYDRFIGWEEVGAVDEKTPLYKNKNENDKEKRNLFWYYDEKDKQMKVYDYKAQSKLRNNDKWNSDYHKDDVTNQDYNSLRYDQEYHFFKQLESKHPDVFSSLVEKLQYFDPAFHSMTPEGFMGRLNFLHQCTRQGDTIANSDKNGFMANNLAFGRPPFCILRLGDFYYQKIVIRTINITYDPLVLDLNNEGVGVVPLIANVTISFNFIGGGDLTGPVRRLQNAMSFNYYANGRLYDNRADRVDRLGTNNWDTMDMGKVDFNNSYFHNVKMSK